MSSAAYRKWIEGIKEGDQVGVQWLGSDQIRAAKVSKVTRTLIRTGKVGWHRRGRDVGFIHGRGLHRIIPLTANVEVPGLPRAPAVISPATPAHQG